MRAASVLFTVPLLLLVACGGPGGGSAADDDLGWDTAGDEWDVTGDEVTSSAVDLIGINPPEKPWGEMTHEEREWDMIGRFLPVMRELFADHDAERWAQIECETCHGDDMEARHYALPSANMIPIPMLNTPAYEAAKNADLEVTVYMEDTIVPAMRTMLGFGEEASCSTCHPVPGAPR